MIGFWWTVNMEISMVRGFALIWSSILTFADAAMHEAVPAITSYGVSPIVRVPDFQSWMIKRMSNRLDIASPVGSFSYFS